MKIEVNNIHLNYIMEGQGRPLILLHGNGEDHHIFDKLTSKLKRDFTVYAVDSRNHGDSTKTANYTYETMAEDICQFIQKLELKDVYTLGFSDGAIISLLLELRHSGTLGKMALLGINLKPTDFKKSIYRYLEVEFEKTKDPLIKTMLEQPNIELDELSDIHIPVLVVAAQDDIYSRKSFQYIVKALPNAVLKIMQQHDHGSYIIDQDILYPDLKAFFG
jgi:pimeloyl-ACP methyl ester carboxylesterase